MKNKGIIDIASNKINSKYFFQNDKIAAVFSLPADASTSISETLFKK